MVKTRGALEREKLKQTTNEDSEVRSHKSCIAPDDPKDELKNYAEPSTKAFSLRELPREKEGSVKTELGVRTSICSNKTSNVSSLMARKRQLELDAAEAKARIEKDLIDKRLAADLAALEDEMSQKSHCSRDRQSVAGTSHKVEQWLEKSHLDEEEQRTLAVSRQESNPATQDWQHLAQVIEVIESSSKEIVIRRSLRTHERPHATRRVSASASGGP